MHGNYNHFDNEKYIVETKLTEGLGGRLQSLETCPSSNVRS